MANSDAMKKNNTQQELKHLDFVRIAAINMAMWLTCMYDYAKQNSGPLRSAVETVEGAVTTVVTPVYNKFKHIPDHLLVFLDHKVNLNRENENRAPMQWRWSHRRMLEVQSSILINDECPPLTPEQYQRVLWSYELVDVASVKFEEHAPPLAKQAATQVYIVFNQTAQLAKEVVHQAQVNGPLAASQYAANESKELILTQSVKVWSKLDKFPPVHMVAEIAVPTATHWSEKYNQVITDFRGKGYAVFSYVPLVPIDEIAKAFKKTKSGNGSDVADSSAGQVAASH